MGAALWCAVSVLGSFASAWIGARLAAPRLPAPPYFPPMDTSPPVFTELADPTTTKEHS